MQLGISQSQHSLVALLHQNDESKGPTAPKSPNEFEIFFNKLANSNEFQSPKVTKSPTMAVDRRPMPLVESWLSGGKITWTIHCAIVYADS